MTSTQSENPPEEIILSNDTETINHNQEIENMEVHKHPHHVTHKKKGIEYLLEFFMLFLAVFLGFVAENIREQQVEKNRELEFIKSLTTDLRDDIKSLDATIAFEHTAILKLDTLIYLLNNPALAKKNGDSIAVQLLHQFEFITRWCDLNEEQQQSKYNEYACHELNYFLFVTNKLSKSLLFVKKKL